MILAILITVLLLGGVWVYGVPVLQKAVPSTWVSNTWMQILFTGVFLLVTVFVVHLIVRGIGVKSVTEV